MKNSFTLREYIRMNFIYLFLFLIIITISISGAIMNTYVCYTNSKKMPVKTTSTFSSDTHFSYVDDLEVNNSIFTDRFKSKNGFYYSIGDTLMCLCIYLTFIVSTFMLCANYKKMRIIKNKQKMKNEK